MEIRQVIARILAYPAFWLISLVDWIAGDYDYDEEE